MLHFIGASIVWWLGICTPLLLAISKLYGGEYLASAISCALALSLMRYGLGYLGWAQRSWISQTDFISIYE